MITWDIKNRNAQTMMITGTVSNENGSTVVTLPWKSMCRKTENLPLNHRWSKNARKTFLNIDQKIISMYAKGMTTRQISETIEDIYGFETSEGFISAVTDKILP